MPTTTTTEQQVSLPVNSKGQSGPPPPPSFIARTGAQIREAWHVLHDKYVIAIFSVDENKVVTAKKYLTYNDGGKNEVDFVDSPKTATCFGYIMGRILVSKLIFAFADSKTAQIDLMPWSDAAFVEEVTNGPNKI